MKQTTELPEELCADEAVCFIADRHHVTPQQLLRHFLCGEVSIPLEDNEVEILKIRKNGTLSPFMVTTFFLVPV